LASTYEHAWMLLTLKRANKGSFNYACIDQTFWVDQYLINRKKYILSLWEQVETTFIVDDDMSIVTSINLNVEYSCEIHGPS